MTVDFDSLMARQSIADIKNSVIAACEAVGFYVSRLPGLARLRKLALDAVPAIVYTATEVNAEAIRGGLLDYAEGDWLELLAVNLFGLDGRIEETFATVQVTFTNAGSEPYVFADKEVRVGNGIVTYTAPAFSLAAVGNDGDEVTVVVTATVAGTDGNADAGEITEMVTTFNGVTCTNPSNARGNDRETDEQLRARCRLARAALSNAGHVAAIELVALSATRDDGTAIGVTRVQVLENDPSLGDVTVYVADDDGPIDVGDVATIDDLLRTLVIPTGVNFTGTFNATPVTVAITYSARSLPLSGFDVSDLEDAVAEELATLFASVPVGGYQETPPNGLLYRSELAAVISQTQLGGSSPIKNVTVTLPAADVALSPGEVAVLGAITPSITEL